MLHEDGAGTLDTERHKEFALDVSAILSRDKRKLADWEQMYLKYYDYFEEEKKFKEEQQQEGDVYDSDEEKNSYLNQMEKDMEFMYMQYLKKKKKTKIMRAIDKKNLGLEADQGLDDEDPNRAVSFGEEENIPGQDQDTQASELGDNEENKNPLMIELGSKRQPTRIERASRWYGRDVFEEFEKDQKAIAKHKRPRIVEESDESSSDDSGDERESRWAHEQGGQREKRKKKGEKRKRQEHDISHENEIAGTEPKIKKRKGQASEGWAEDMKVLMDQQTNNTEEKKWERSARHGERSRRQGCGNER